MHAQRAAWDSRTTGVAQHWRAWREAGWIVRSGRGDAGRIALILPQSRPLLSGKKVGSCVGWYGVGYATPKRQHPYDAPPADSVLHAPYHSTYTR